MSAGCAAESRVPFSELAAIYLVSMPLAWFAMPLGFSWDTSVAGFAVGLTWLIGLAPWWLAINALFVPALAFGLTVDVSPAWALASFAALVLVYGGIWKSRVPLFFTSRRAQQALAGLIPADARRFLDVGCGDARVLARLAAARSECRFEGVEQALVPWLLGRLRCRWSRGRCAVLRADLWKTALSAYDVVYAYLSPAVMPELWAKARREMRPGTRLISAFAVPGAPAADCVEVGDALRTRLYVWQMGAEP